METWVSGKDISSYNKRASPAIWHLDEGWSEYLYAHHSGEYLPCTCGIHCLSFANVYIFFVVSDTITFHSRYLNLASLGEKTRLCTCLECHCRTTTSVTAGHNMQVEWSLELTFQLQSPDTPLSLDLPFCLPFNCPRKIAVWRRYRYPLCRDDFDVTSGVQEGEGTEFSIVQEE